jgi:hypothetical protein
MYMCILQPPPFNCVCLCVYVFLFLFVYVGIYVCLCVCVCVCVAPPFVHSWRHVPFGRHARPPRQNSGSGAVTGTATGGGQGGSAAKTGDRIHLCVAATARYHGLLVAVASLLVFFLFFVVLFGLFASQRCVRATKLAPRHPVINWVMPQGHMQCRPLAKAGMQPLSLRAR